MGVELCVAALLACGLQLGARALGEGLGAHRCEQVVGHAQLVAGINPLALVAQPFAVEQVCPCEVGPQPQS